MRSSKSGKDEFDAHLTENEQNKETVLTKKLCYCAAQGRSLPQMITISPPHTVNYEKTYKSLNGIVRGDKG